MRWMILVFFVGAVGCDAAEPCDCDERARNGEPCWSEDGGGGLEAEAEAEPADVATAETDAGCPCPFVLPCCDGCDFLPAGANRQEDVHARCDQQARNSIARRIRVAYCTGESAALEWQFGEENELIACPAGSGCYHRPGDLEPTCVVSP